MLANDAVGTDAVASTSSTSTGPATITLVGAACTQANTCSTGSVAASAPGGPATINLAAAACIQANTASTAVAGVVPPGGTIKVPASRTASFTSSSRVVPFGSEAAGPNTNPAAGPYWRSGHWYADKPAQDKLYYSADISRDLTDSGTTAVGVAGLPSASVTVLEGPTLQGSTILIKVGVISSAANADNHITLRVTCADGEIFDKTLYFNASDDKSHVFGKDPDDQRYYAIDFTPDLTAAGNGVTIASLQSPIVTGLTLNAGPTLQGSRGIVQLSGLDTTGNSANSCMLIATLSTGEQIYRTIYFTRVDG